MEEKSKPKIKKWQLILIIIIAILLIVFGTTWAFYNSKLNKLNYDKNHTLSIDKTISLTTSEEQDISGLPNKDDSSIVAPEGEIFKSQDVFNILLLGTDERTPEFNVNARADSMMIFSINKKKKSAKLVSLERGVGVPIEGRNPDLLTHTFRYGGANLTLKTVRDCFKVDVEKYVRVNFNTFAQIVDAVGGVDVVLTELEAKALNNEVYTNAVTKNRVHEGENHLDGYDALQYSRLRYIDSDWVRIKRQRTVIQAVVNKTKNMNLIELNTFVNKVLPLIQTNLTKSEITSLVVEAPNFMGVEIEQKTIPEKGTYWGVTGVDGRKMIGVDFKKNSQILKDFLYN